MEIDSTVADALLSGAGGGGAVILAGTFLIRKTLSDLTDRVGRAEDAVQECRRTCDLRLEKGELEYRQILMALNEIKIQFAGFKASVRKSKKRKNG